MTLRLQSLASLAIALVVFSALGQAPVPPPLPTVGPAPLLFLRFIGPAGMRVTFNPGTRAARSFEAPAVAGVRAGYICRTQLDHFAADPKLTIYPSIEARGSLWLGPKLNAADYPAPVVLSDTDIERIRAGSMVTKIIYLEHPERAIPVSSKPDNPLETDVVPDHDLLAEAREMGRPVAVVRFGSRAVPPEELARFAVPGTLLLPGEHGLPPALVPPCLPMADRIFLDPYLGPRPPEEECLKDGGDTGMRAGLDGDGRLHGVDPSDTVAVYTDAQGHRRIVCSNRVCVCVPRFAVLRAVTPPASFEASVVVGKTDLVVVREQIRAGMPPRLAGQYESLQAVKSRERPSIWTAEVGLGQVARVEILQAHQLDLGPVAALGTQAAYQLRERERTEVARQMAIARELSHNEGVKENVQVVQTAIVARVQGGPEVISAVAETRDFTVCCNETPCLPEKPLALYKCADRPAAKVGDVVTFTLRYANHGGRPMTDVAISDSLTGRLEYIPGSAQADRDAVFTTQPNEAGSVLLRWEITGRLQPGEGGAVRFQARIR